VAVAKTKRVTIAPPWNDENGDDESSSASDESSEKSSFWQKTPLEAPYEEGSGGRSLEEV
jgi:hypothetical protein